MNENKKAIDAHSNFLKILNTKNKQFEQNLFNDFLEDLNIRAKQAKSFDIKECREVIKKSTNPKIKQKFNTLINSIERAAEPVEDDKPKLKIKSYRSSIKDMYPKSELHLQ